MWWVHHGYGFPPFVGLFLFLIVMGLIVRIFLFRRCGPGRRGWNDGRFEAEAILRRRLVNGEITEEEFHRLMGVLTK